MPFVQRVVEPKFLSRRSLHGEDGQPLVTDYELEAVTNNTLSSALRQLASLVLIANDIFEDLTKQLQDVCERSKKLRNRIESVEGKVVAYDPRKVTVPESNITTFSLRREHFSSGKDVAITKNLFAVETRPDSVQRLYEAAAKTPVHMMRQLDRYRRDGRRSSRYFLCTPILGGERRSVAKIKHKPGIDIETRMPAAVNDLRRWTSDEAFGDVTVTPDCTSRIASSTVAGAAEVGVEDDSADSGTDHRLPSPEEQVQTVALRFPPELVAVDVSGRAFDRMTSFRRSLIHVEVDADGAVRRRAGRHRKPRGRRRNTIAGTDKRELEQAISGDNPSGSADVPDISSDGIAVVRSASSDLLRSKDDSPSDSKKSHFSTLKQWGKVKLKLIRSVSGESSKASPDEINIYETVTTKGRKGDTKHEKKHSSVGTNIPISSSSGAMNMAVKLREGSVRRRALTNGKEDPIHSSSGNWSASSESGRASIGSENTTTTHQPKSTTTLSSAATSSNSLNQHQAPSSSVSSRRKFLNTSTSSSVSEGTLTPDIMSDLVTPFPDDGETSSIYSCDTEGYYTSFHLDSGLKTLKEEETLSPQIPLHSTVALSASPGRGNTTLTAENEYELFGKGSTSTTTSSAGTVCTTLLVGNDNMSVSPAPAVPERKSSLEGKQEANSQMVVAVIHKQHSEVPSESPDSGHNTSSSPVDSTNSPPGTLTGRSSEYEFSESDLEGVDRIERIRVKTTINSSRIPSMCVITPPQSDDETCQYVPSNRKHSSQALPSLRSNDDPRNCSLTGRRDNKQHLNLEMASSQQSRSSFYDSLPRTLEKQLSTDSDHSSETEPSRIRSRSACRAQTPMDYRAERSASVKVRIHGLSPSPTRKTVVLNDTKSNTQQQKSAATLRSSLQPFNNMIDKVKCALSSAGGGSRKVSKSSAGEESDTSPTESTASPPADAGDYVTIADIHNNVRAEMSCQGQTGNIYSNTAKKTPLSLPEKMEYVSLNELPSPTRASSPCGSVLLSPSDTLERKKRQGARVTLDSEGKVVYTSDSLRRNKGAHTTFEPGPYVKDPTIATPVASPVPPHRVPKSNIRPIVVSNVQGRNSPCVIGRTADVLSSPVSQRGGPLSPRQQSSSTRGTATSPTSPQLGKVIIKAGNKTTPMMRVASPPLAVASRPLSPKQSSVMSSGRGAYVHMQSTHQRSASPPGGKSTISSVTSPTSDDEGKIPPCPANPKLIDSYLQRKNPALYNRISEQETLCSLNPTKVKRSDSYRMANSPFMQARKMTNIEIAAANINNTPQNIMTFKGDTDFDSMKENKLTGCGNDTNNPLSMRNMGKGRSDSWNVKHGGDSSRAASHEAEETLTKTVMNPNLLGRKFYGPQIKVDPNLLTAIAARPVTMPQDTERARVLNNSGYPSLGYDSPHERPPRYVSPPPAQQLPWSPSHHSNGSMRVPSSQDPQSFWTLPARRPQYQGTDSNMLMNKQEPYADYQHNKRFNTIATTRGGRNINWNHVYAQHNDRTQSAAASYYLAPSMSVGAYESSQSKNSVPQGPNLSHHNHGFVRGAVYSQLRPKYPTPASIPKVPNNERICAQNNNGRTYNASYKPGVPLWQDCQNGFCSSTPTKKDRMGLLSQNDSTAMSFGMAFSPIEKCSQKKEITRHIPRTNGNTSTSAVLKVSHESNNDSLPLVSAPKTSMTSEEIFVAIHKSKKRLNIKTDSDSFSRSSSPSCSSLTNLSPGGSQSSVYVPGRSITPIKGGPETRSFDGDNSVGSRHSWSPNSGEYFDFYSRFECKTPSPGTSPGSRQSWACDRLGPRQQTSRNDFKRLLLQQGAGGCGNSGGRISAVEQLKLTRQQKLGSPSSNGPAVNNSYTPRSPAEKRTGASKLLQSPRSNTAWRFASPRTDVLSSTILEDCAEEDDASNSPQHSPLTPNLNKLLPATSDSAGNSSAQRPLNLPLDTTAKHSPSKDIIKHQEKHPVSQQNLTELSSRTAMKHLASNSSSNKFISSEPNTTPKSILLPKVGNLKNGGLLPPELLSPSNVKENVNTNLQHSIVVTTNSGDKVMSGDAAVNSVTSLKNQPPVAQLILQSPSPRINMLLSKQKVYQYPSHGTSARSILGALTASKSPPKTTLETAL